MKFYELMRAFFRKMVQMCSNFVTTCTIRGTQGAKLPADATFSGRSMVEMLGVLAIIGVLSVGAISGYSKALERYRWNKFINNINWLAQVSLEIANKERLTSSMNINSILQVLKYLPDEFSIPDHPTNHFTYTPNPGFGYGYINIQTDKTVQISFFYAEKNFCNKFVQFFNPYLGSEVRKITVLGSNGWIDLVLPTSLSQIENMCNEDSIARVVVTF